MSILLQECNQFQLIEVFSKVIFKQQKIKPKIIKELIKKFWKMY